ncbi:hypothetical protein [Lentilactobacillus parafarraginis]|nr:hypothetical protein [Lentilactobacillus parafarraginis]
MIPVIMGQNKELIGMNFKDALHLIKKNHVNINDDMLKEALEK